MSRKDYIGPTIGKKKAIVLPEGPTAEFSTKASKGMSLAKDLLGTEEAAIPGQIVQKPLQMGPPIPNFKPKPRERPQDPRRAASNAVEKQVGAQVMLGNTHINSYQAILKNDRMAKPAIKAWQDEDS